MQPIHLAIGVVEGLATAAVVSFVWQARPRILDVSCRQQPDQGRGAMTSLCRPAPCRH